MALTSGEQRAMSKALALGGASAVQRMRYGLYRVASASRPGAMHTVRVDDRGRYRCDCEAGVREKPCWHAAAVFVAKVEHAGGARVTGPGRRPASRAGGGPSAGTFSRAA